MRTLLDSPTIQYCESAGQGLIRRPFYAFSNLAFFAAGILILVDGRGSKLSIQFGFSALLIGLFSFMYDSTFTYLAQLFDLLGMCIFVGLLIYVNVSTMLKRVYVGGVLAVLILLGMSVIVLLGGYAGNVIFGMLVMLAILSELYLFKTERHQGVLRWLVPSMLFIVGTVFWFVDARQIYCTDIGFLNGRAIFHYICAIVIVLLYRFYKQQARPASL